MEVRNPTQRKIVEILKGQVTFRQYVWKTLTPPLMIDNQSNERVDEIKDLFRKNGLLDDWYESLNKTLAREDKTRKEENAKGHLEYILSKFTAIMYIPIPKNKPVIIFKMFGNPLYHFSFQKKNQTYFDLMMSPIKCDYFVFWGTEKFGYEFPSIIGKHYDKDFVEFLNARCVQYSVTDLPKGVVEIPLKQLMDTDELKVYNPSITTPIKEFLRSVGYLQETRGRGSKKSPVQIERDKLIIEIYNGLQRKKPLPVKKVVEELNCLFQQGNFTDEERSRAYLCSEATVRRVLQEQIKSSRKSSQ
jgi:hypothetical protein